MMVIIETIKKIATGKTKIERRQEAEANSIIRRKAMASALKEREIQSIRLAKERERISADQKIKKMKEPPKQYFSPGWGRGSGMINILGGQPTQPQKRKVRRVVYVNRPIKRKRKTRVVYVNRPIVSQPAHYKVI